MAIQKTSTPVSCGNVMPSAVVTLIAESVTVTAVPVDVSILQYPEVIHEGATAHDGVINFNILANVLGFEQVIQIVR